MRLRITITIALLALLAARAEAQIWLKQSTAVVVPLGPFVDKGDAVTLKTTLVSALDNASTGIMLSKNGGTLTVRHATVTATTYDSRGCYKVTLDTTDTSTLGRMRVMYEDATTCLPVWLDCMVVTANTWDTLVGGTTNLNADAKAINAVPTTSVTTVNAHFGTVQPIKFSGTGVSALPDVQMVKAGPTGAGTSISATDIGSNTTQIISAVDDVDVEVTNIQGRLPAALTTDGLMKSDSLRLGGTLLTPRDIGASVLVGDKTGFTLAVSPPTAVTIATAVRSELAIELARLDVATSTRLGTAGYTAPSTVQQIRDALKLTPSVGAAAVNSIDDKIDKVYKAVR